MLRPREQKFAVADLQAANANRANTPWVVVGFHRCADVAAAACPAFLALV